MDDLFGDRCYQVNQMLGCNMGEDSADEFDGPFEAATEWVTSTIGLPTCHRLLDELKHLYDKTATPLERRRLLTRDVIFLADDGSDLDPLLAEVELLLRVRIARES